jgi:hypothetical protein
MKYIIALLLLIPFASSAQERGFYSEGREFFLGHLHPASYEGTFFTNSEYVVYAIITALSEARITISYFDASGKEVEVTTHTAGSGSQKQIPLSISSLHSNVLNGDVAEYKTCHITSDKPISVVYFSDAMTGWGSYLALPVSAWGKKYVVASYNDGPEVQMHQSASNEMKRSCGYFTIVAAYNGTEVSITPSALTRGGAVGVTQGPGANGTPKPYTVSLNKGQSYLVKSASALSGGTDDISGTIVEANKPVTVISGHQMAAVGDGWCEWQGQFGESDSRDYLIEQLIPVEFWDNTGYYGVPFLSPKDTVKLGLGDNYRIYSSDTDVPSSIDVTLASSHTLRESPGPYRPKELTNYQYPLEISALDTNSRISVIQYDLRSQVSEQSFAAPSMQVIVPRSQWQHSYHLQGYPVKHWGFNSQYIWKNYITVISTSPITNVMASRNNSQFMSLNSAAPAIKTWSSMSMPEGSSLVASTFSLGVFEKYYLKSDKPFMVYHFGFYGRDGDGDFPGDGADDFWGSDSHPCGMQLYNKFVNKNLTVTVDTLCNGWNICASDLNADGGIRFVTLIDDPNGSLYYGKNYVSSNCSFEAETDPLGLHQFTIGEDKSNLCFKIHSNSPDQAVYAPIAIYDKAGNCEILELRMEPRKITLTPNDTKLLFTKTPVSNERCETFTIRNLPTNSEPMFVNTVSTTSPYFTVKSVTPPVPCTIFPGDSLRMEVCFMSSDNVTHVDRLKVSADCNTIDLPLQAQALTPVISAVDLAFGTVNNGITSCKDVEVNNGGLIEFSVTGIVLETNEKFSLDTSNLKLPWLIQPGAKRKVRICYKSDSDESDTVRLMWQTDILPPYSTQNKDTSIITANGEGHVSVQETKQRSLAVRVSPQPAHEYVELSVTSPESGKLSVKIYDVLGKEVNNGITRFIDEGISRVRMKVSDLAKGTYIIVTSVDGMMETSRVIID